MLALNEIAHIEESRSRSSRIMDIIRYKQLHKQHYNIVIFLYYDYGATVRHPLALHNRYPETHEGHPYLGASPR